MRAALWGRILRASRGRFVVFPCSLQAGYMPRDPRLYRVNSDFTFS